MTETILSGILRTVVAFFLLIAVTRIVGRKAISQMTFFDFGVAITFGSVAANLGLGQNSNSISAATVLITLGFLGLIMNYLYTKSFLIRKWFNSEPIVLIENGEIVKDNMERSHTTLTSLTSMLREKNTFNIADVEFAILENDGKLSVLPKSQNQTLTPSDMNVPTSYEGLTKELIIDGNIMYENLRDANLDEQWLIDQLSNRKIYNIKDVFFAALDSSGKLYVSKGLSKKEKHGKYGIE